MLPARADAQRALPSVAAPPKSKSAHVSALDGLRGIAILGVVWYHAWLVSNVQSLLHVGSFHLNLQAFAATGFMGVDLFFFVSGFCLFFPYARHLLEGKHMPTLREFAARRLEKILPSYLVALAVFAIVHRGWFDSTAQWLGHLFAHLAFVHPLLFDTFGSISGPFWTLGIEVQFYALFPLVCWFFRKQPLLMFAALVVIANLYRLILAHVGADTMLYPISQLPGVIDLFGAGMLAAYAIVFLSPHCAQWKARLAATACALGGIALLVVMVERLAAVAQAGGTPSEYAWVNAYRSGFAALFALCAVGSTLALPWWQAVISHRVLIYLAAISYNLYLWHLEIIVWYEAHVEPFLAGYLHANLITHLLVPALLAVAVAAIATRFVERPFLKGGWRPHADRARSFAARMLQGRMSKRREHIEVPVFQEQTATE